MGCSDNASGTKDYDWDAVFLEEAGGIARLPGCSGLRGFPFLLHCGASSLLFL